MTNEALSMPSDRNIKGVWSKFFHLLMLSNSDLNFMKVDGMIVAYRLSSIFSNVPFFRDKMRSNKNFEKIRC